MAKERHTAAFVIGAAIGGVVGAIYGLLNAPRSGPATRADLTERWHDVEERTAQEVAQVEHELRDRIAPEWAPGGDIRVTREASPTGAAGEGERL
jgi:gas vesicle protein